MNEYKIPVSVDNIPPVMVLEHEGKFYSFGCTFRTAQSVWTEVKNKLETLVQCEFTAEEVADMVQYKVEK